MLPAVARKEQVLARQVRRLLVEPPVVSLGKSRTLLMVELAVKLVLGDKPTMAARLAVAPRMGPTQRVITVDNLVVAEVAVARREVPP